MNDNSQPPEIAREALRRLAARRLPPTPDNFRALYHEIAGTAPEEVFPDRNLKDLVSRLPRTNPVQIRFARQVEEGISARDWSAISAAIESVVASRAPPAWSTLIREALAQFERRHAGLTTARKRESLEHVLSASGSDPDQLFGRLSALVRSWADASVTGRTIPPGQFGPDDARTNAVPGPEPVAAVPGAAAGCQVDEHARRLIGELIESSATLLLADDPELADEAASLSRDLRAAGDAVTLQAMVGRLQTFVTHLRWRAGDQAELKNALLHLMQIVIDNIAELLSEDQWLRGQIAMVSEALSPPLNLRRLEEVENRLKDVIYKQSALKRGLNDAKERLKAMLARFVDHLANMSESTSEFHDRIEGCAVRIGAAKDISELTDVIEEVMRETRSMQASTGRARDELRLMKDKAEESEREIIRLQHELALTSEMVRHDQLTGSLNRKGLDEALQREFARADRRSAPLCVGLLDVDNFKVLNDTYGHQAGDDALVHLARILRDTLRPQDSLARYGGEEFVVLLPETALGDAAGVMTRLQRELTKRFFLRNNERVLITFSAGVTQVIPGEERKTALARADAAMYESKRAGKNRVTAA